MNDSDLIDLFGGTNKVAEFFKIKQPSVSEWRVNGMPSYRRDVLLLAKKHPAIIGIWPVRGKNKRTKGVK